jgi:dTDP-4-dehydrorhamnose reductase
LRILVTGVGGQLGSEVARLAAGRFETTALSHADLDITDPKRTIEAVHEFRPDAILHTAAFTAVDRAETEAEAAFRVNAFGTRNLAVATESIGARMLYVSTDYVFDGRADTPYQEHDAVNPQSVYGRSKRAGEELVMTLCRRYFIVRTSWVFGAKGANFVKTMLRLGREAYGEQVAPLRVVNDQVGCPTYAPDLAQLLLDMVETDLFGVYHASNAEPCSWYEFACAIMEEAGLPVKVDPCTTDEFPRPASRPCYSVLGAMALRAAGFTPLRPWREALRDFLAVYAAMDHERV